MDRIRVIHAKSFHPISIAIRLWTWSPWSHVGVLSKGSRIVYESRGGVGVVKTPIDEFKARYPEWHIGFMPVIDAEAAYAYYESQVGVDYDEMTIISQMLRMTHHETDGLSCSEYVAEGSGLFRRELNRRITPLHTWLLTQDED